MELNKLLHTILTINQPAARLEREQNWHVWKTGKKKMLGKMNYFLDDIKHNQSGNCAIGVGWETGMGS